MDINYISADAFHHARSRDPNLFVIDVRTAVEHAACHVDGAKLYPLQTFSPKEVLNAVGERDQIFVLCKSGGRAKKAADSLAEATDKEVFVVVGGTDACELLDMPIVRGKATMSLERQVRIAAGTLVVAGVMGAVILHPGFIALSAFVGVGLVFAGVTDTCALGMVLARMPWNSVKENNANFLDEQSEGLKS